MNIIFFGTPSFAAHILKSLLEKSVNIVAVVSKPDKAQGRSSKLVPTAVKEVALEYSIPLYQPEKASNEEFAQILSSLNPDLFVVVAYGEIIKQFLLDIPKKGAINVHGSLLPKYRGAAPIQRAIINGEKETGISIIYLIKKMDAGDILETIKTDIGENETYGELSERLAELGTKVLLKTIDAIENERIHRTVQDESLVTMAPKIEIEECQINWNQNAQQIHNLIRGVNPNPCAWCKVKIGDDERRLKIFSTQLITNHQLPLGDFILTKEGVIVGCNNSSLLLKDVQLEGKKRMSSSELFRGININKFL